MIQRYPQITKETLTYVKKGIDLKELGNSLRAPRKERLKQVETKGKKAGINNAHRLALDQ